MKLKNKFILFSILILGIAAFVACNKPTKDPNISYYTCPMHPQIHKDEPGNCPICSMKLVPVYKDKTEGGIIITPERQQLIGVKFAPVVKKDAVKEIRTTGRIAYDPELAVAQQEFIEISKNVPSLKQAAISRLRLLGMGDEEIRSLGQKKGNDSTWVYATLYESDMGLVKPGDSATIILPADGRKITGTVRALSPVVNAATRSVQARIEIPSPSELLKPNTFVNVLLRASMGEKLTVPKSAVIDTGTRKIAYRAREGNRFQSVEIKTGAELGAEVVVLEGLNEGDQVVASAAFLVDSESQLKSSEYD